MTSSASKCISRVRSWSTGTLVGSLNSLEMLAWERCITKIRPRGDSVGHRLRRLDLERDGASTAHWSWQPERLSAMSGMGSQRIEQFHEVPLALPLQPDFREFVAEHSQLLVRHAQRANLLDDGEGLPVVRTARAALDHMR